MRQVWSDERKFQIWLEIEILAFEAMAELGQIPKEDAAEIRKRARFRISAASAFGIWPSSAIASQASVSISSQISNLWASDQFSRISGRE